MLESRMHCIIGIDPDSDKSGFAVLIGDKLTVETVGFFDLLDRLVCMNPHLVVIEAGWLIKTANWHFAKNKAIAGKIGHDVGRNHQAGIYIAEFCERRGYKVKLVKPTPSRSKVGGKFFERLTGIKQSNPEKRDAAILILGLKDFS